MNRVLGKSRPPEMEETAARGGTLMGGKKAAKGRLLEAGETTEMRGEGQEEQQGQFDPIEESEDRLDARDRLRSGLWATPLKARSSATMASQTASLVEKSASRTNGRPTPAHAKPGGFQNGQQTPEAEV